MNRAALLLGAALALVSCEAEEPQARAPISYDDNHNASMAAVASAIAPNNKFGVQRGDLRSTPNPKGEGEFVYVERTRFSGTERYLVWAVVEGKAYALNGPSKEVTPSLPWPRDAREGEYERTGLSPYSATEAIETVFGKYQR